MTHPPELIARSLALAGAGRSATEVARLVGLPRATVRDWLAGRRPGRTREGELRCPLCSEPHELERLPIAYVYLLGMYLGDGCISRHPRGVFRLRISCDARYPEIASECEEAMRTVAPRNRVSRVERGTWLEVYAYSKLWPCVFPQHGLGKKHERPIVLAVWQRELVSERPDLLLRGLLHSDGCRFMNTGRAGWSHPRYAFTNRSQGIRRIFTDACDSIGLRWTQSGDRTIYVSRKADVAILDLFVGPKR